MTTLEELLSMMAEDANKSARPAVRPPPIPPKKTEAIAKEELESLDDGPVLKDGLWPSALPRPARRGPPPPPPGRRPRGTAPLVETVTSGLIDVRAMAMAYAADADRSRTAELEAAAAAEAAEMTIQLPALEPPAASEPEAAPTPVIAEGTKPIPAAVEEPAPEVDEEEPAVQRAAALWIPIARRVAIAVAVGGVAALAITFLVKRVLAESVPLDPIDFASRVEPLPAMAFAPAEAPVAAALEPAVAEAAVEPVVIVQPTQITEVGVEPQAEPTPPAATDEVIGGPAAEAFPRSAVARDAVETAQPVAPPPELLADGCFDAACAVTAPRVRRPARAAMITVPARLPTKPSNSEISSAIFAAHDQIEGCGEVYGASGAVPLEIRIAPSGRITKVVVGAGTTRFRTCVSDIVRRVKMPASLVGTSAKFPVLIR